MAPAAAVVTAGRGNGATPLRADLAASRISGMPFT